MPHPAATLNESDASETDHGVRWMISSIPQMGSRPAAIGSLALLTIGCGLQDSGEAIAPAAPPPEVVTNVVDVIDGDTIEIEIEGIAERVRYIGMDTPEVGQRCAAEATEANSRLVSGKRIRLVPDKENRDIYERLLRYIYSGDEFINLKLVELGLARPLKILPNDGHSEEIAEAAQTARDNGAGCLWDPELLAEVKRLQSFATPSPTPSERIIVEKMRYNASGDDSKNLNDEYFTLINLGPDLQVGGWTVRDSAGHDYMFPRFEWRTGTRLTLRTGSGLDNGGIFHWGARSPIWNNSGDLLTLSDASGNAILVYAYGR